MVKKIHLVTLVLLGIASFCLADTSSDMEQAKQNIYFLIESGKFSEAKAAADKLAVDYAGQGKLSDAQYWIAERYERVSKFEEAKSIYQQIIQNDPNDPMANKARMGASKSNAMSLIMSEQYSQAREAIDKMTIDFAGNADLPEML